MYKNLHNLFNHINLCDVEFFWIVSPVHSGPPDRTSLIQREFTNFWLRLLKREEMTEATFFITLYPM